MLKGFSNYLKEKNLSNNTISAYVYTIEMFDGMFKEVNKDNVLAFKGYLLEHFKVKTVNLRIQAVNKYLEYLNKKDIEAIIKYIQTGEIDIGNEKIYKYVSRPKTN